MGELERQRAIYQKLSGMGSVSGRPRSEPLSTGFPALDTALGTGGLPRGCIVEIFGTASCGKTAFALQVIAHGQRNRLGAAWIDAENAFDAAFAAQLGVDLERLPVAGPSSAEDALEVAGRIAASGAVDLVVVDSAAALVPELEIQAGIGSVGAGLHSRVLASALRRLSRAATRGGSCILFLNQSRAHLGSGGGAETSSGGPPLKLYSAVRIVLSASGRRVRFRVIKNRLAAAYREAELEWRAGEGFNRA